jgi:Ran GTPase-activating protein (RanGAP) involved in mRNA processing and transport
MSTTQEIVLSWNDIVVDDGAKLIADALKDNKSLESLVLSKNNIGSDGAKMIADALKINKPLTLLDINENNIGDNGANQIADALKIKSTFTSCFRTNWL